MPVSIARSHSWDRDEARAENTLHSAVLTDEAAAARFMRTSSLMLFEIGSGRFLISAIASKLGLSTCVSILFCISSRVTLSSFMAPSTPITRAWFSNLATTADATRFGAREWRDSTLGDALRAHVFRTSGSRTSFKVVVTASGLRAQPNSVHRLMELSIRSEESLSEALTTNKSEAVSGW